jgi:glutamine amidotransferase
LIAIIDYQLGNVKAFANIYKELGVPHRIASHPEQLVGATRVILPGVGAFDQAMTRLERSGMRTRLEELAQVESAPVLGVCVGMQILMKSSEEGAAQGLGWIEGDVAKFRPSPEVPDLQVPHMGWNEAIPRASTGLFAGLDHTSLFYFLHSYHVRVAADRDVLAESDYGARFVCAVGRGNIYGVQFHPEKSHHAGVQLLKNFAAL